MPPHKLDDQELELANKVLSGDIPRKTRIDIENRFLEMNRFSEPTSWKEIIDEAMPLPPQPLGFRWTAKWVIQELQKLSPSKLDEELLIGALLQLYDLEKLSLPGERQDLEDILGRVEDAKRALLRLLKKGDYSHRGTILALTGSAARIKQALKPWNEKRGKWGPNPQTRILIALMAYFLERTGSLHDVELAKLAEAAYKAAGSKRSYEKGTLRKLWKRKSGLRKNWLSVLTTAHKVHAPGIGSWRFKPPQTPEKRVLGLQNRQKDVNQPVLDPATPSQDSGQ